MIATLLRIQWTHLRRDRVAQLLTFVVPVAFFTIFAIIFGGRGGGTGRVRVAVVDESHTTASARLVRALQRTQGLRVRTTAPASASDTTRVPLDRARAEALVRSGEVPIAVVLPAGIDTSLGRFDGGGEPIELLTDPSDPVAPQLVGGLLQKVAMTATPDLMAARRIEQFDRYAGGLTPRQRRAVDAWMPTLRGDTVLADAAADSGGGAADLSGLMRVRQTAVLGRRQDTRMISFYAAGIAVMFLLFSCSAAAGALLEEVESGTLDRVLSSRVGMTGLLAGKWLFLTQLGALQITAMFVYAMLVFRLDLLAHLPGFAVMTLVTAAATGAFGLFLATLCRSRQQLGGISTLVIIVMSALGGSMIPRFLMSEGMQRFGLITFNAWALDGYTRVFWRDARLVDLAPQVGVLLGFTAVFLAVARLMARRWERV
jgi:ABC-2 type transport system permease protein